MTNFALTLANMLQSPIRIVLHSRREDHNIIEVGHLVQELRCIWPHHHLLALVIIMQQSFINIQN